MDTDYLNELLNILSKRVDPNTTWWYYSNDWHAICNICHKNFDLNWKATRDHGMKHLKTSNVLVFV